MSIIEAKADSDSINGFVETARTFATRSVAPIFEGEHADGNPARVEEVLETAFTIGLAASPDPELPGYDYGIWGRAIAETGLLSSARMLSVVAEVCGSIAMNLHVQGIGSQVVSLMQKAPEGFPKKIAPAIQEDYGMPGWQTLHNPELDAPARVLSEAMPAEGGYVLTGRKPFVHAMPGCEHMVVFCREAHCWRCFLVSSAAKNLEMIHEEHRTGLRSCRLSHLRLNRVFVSHAYRLDTDDALAMVIRTMSLNWLGISCVAVGIARGALRAARKYASERYQGGTTIDNHPAVRMLIAGAEANMEAADALVERTAAFDPADPSLVRACAVTRLSALALCSEAVTDSLQVLGGYGYMEDYGMEKRLRDMAVLKSLAGTPQYLKQFIFESRETRP